MDQRKINGSGYYDPTAFTAIERVSREEREQERKVAKLIKFIFKECHKAGFSVEGRIVLKDKKTGRIWR